MSFSEGEARRLFGRQLDLDLRAGAVHLGGLLDRRLLLLLLAVRAVRVRVDVVAVVDPYR